MVGVVDQCRPNGRSCILQDSEAQKVKGLLTNGLPRSATSTKDKLKIRRSVIKFCKKMEARRHTQRKSVFVQELLMFVRKECPTTGVQISDVERWISKCNWIWPPRAKLDAPEDDDESDSDSNLFTAVIESNNNESGPKGLDQLATSESVANVFCLGKRDKEKDVELVTQRPTDLSNHQLLTNEPPRNPSERSRGTHNRISFGQGLVRKLSKHRNMKF